MRLKSMPWSSTALLELAGDIDQMGLGQDPTGDLLGQIGKLIEDTMVPGILASRNSTQEQLDGFRTAFDACPDPQPAADGSGSEGGALVQDPFTQTLACRAKEAVAAQDHSGCVKDLTPLDSAKNGSCHVLQKKDSVPLDPTLCTPMDPYEEWIQGAKIKVEKLKEEHTLLKHGCGNATNLYDDKAKECVKTVNAATGNKTICDDLQAQAEAGLCTAKASEGGSCTTYSTCYNNAESAYTEQNASIIAMHLNWTVQWRTLKRMTCLLDVMQKGGTNDDIDACKEKLWDTSHLDLTYPAIPEKKACSLVSLEAEPCDEDFLAKHYGSNPPAAPAATCTPCVTTTFTTTATATTSSSSCHAFHATRGYFPTIPCVRPGGLSKGPVGYPDLGDGNDGSGGDLFDDTNVCKIGEIRQLCIQDDGGPVISIQADYGGDVGKGQKNGGSYTPDVNRPVKDHCITLAPGVWITSFTYYSRTSMPYVWGVTIDVSSGEVQPILGDYVNAHLKDWDVEYMAWPPPDYVKKSFYYNPGNEGRTIVSLRGETKMWSNDLRFPRLKALGMYWGQKSIYGVK